MRLKNNIPNNIKNTEDLVSAAKKARIKILDMVYDTKSPHIGPSFSIVELLTALYFRYLDVYDKNRDKRERDKFILSKGHGCPALYAVLALKGFMSEEDLAGFGIDGGTLEHHPSFDLSRGIELSTGSLGHGLSVGAGMALADKRDKLKYRTYVMISDGESQSGLVWEAAMFAGFHKLDNLTVIVDYNKIQALGNTREIIDLEPLGKKWEAFGWGVREIDGHNYDEIFSAFDNLPFTEEKPSVIIAHTVKGKGVSFMENNLLWHYRPPDEKEYSRAVEELERGNA